MSATDISPLSLHDAPPISSFSIAGQGFASGGFGLPVVNFTRGGTLLAQERTTARLGSSTPAVSYPINCSSISGPLPGLSAGAVTVQVYNQTGASTYLLVGGVPLTVTD